MNSDDDDFLSFIAVIVVDTLHSICKQIYYDLSTGQIPLACISTMRMQELQICLRKCQVASADDSSALT